MHAGDDEKPGFGQLLLRHRHAAGMSQSELARASGMSVRALRDLERGRAQAALRRSAEVLADALRLPEDERHTFLAVARDGRRRAPRRPESDAGSALPVAAHEFVGREADIARLRTEAGTGGVVVVAGQPGVGKTALAAAAASQLAPEFPDGCLTLDLHGMDEQPVSPQAALERLLRALDVAQARIPPAEAERSNLLRLTLAERRVLILLDNAAAEAQVRPLLVAGPGCLTLITSRSVLAGLEVGRRVHLEPLSDADAVALLGAGAGDGRARDEPEVAAELASLCGNLPLALRIVSDRLATRPHWTLTYPLEQLRDERTRLGSLSEGEHQVRSAFEMSYHRVSPAGRLVFRRLAAVPGADFDTELAAVAAGMPAPEVGLHLDELVDAGLLQDTSVPGRLQFHDLIRLFARERSEREERADERERLSRAVLDHLLGEAIAAGERFVPDFQATSAAAVRQEAADWLEREQSNWTGAQRAAAGIGHHRDVVAVAKAMQWFSDIGRHEFAWDEIFGLGVAAARALGSRDDELELLNQLGWAQYMCLGDYDAALESHRNALAVAAELGSRHGQAWANAYLCSVLRRCGRHEEALEHGLRAAELSEGLGFFTIEVTVRTVVGSAMMAVGHREEALRHLTTLLDEIDRRRSEVDDESWLQCSSWLLRQLGEGLGSAGRWREAAESYGRARSRYASHGVRREEAETAVAEGAAWREAGEPDRARECLDVALAVFVGPAYASERGGVLAELALLSE